MEPQKNQCRYSDLFNANFRPCYMNFILSNLSQIILGRKINFSPLYIVFSKLTLNKVILKWYSRVTCFENHSTFTLRQQIKALHNFKNSQSLKPTVTHCDTRCIIHQKYETEKWPEVKINFPELGQKWTVQTDEIGRSLN